MQRQIIQLEKGDPTKANPTEPPGWEVIWMIEGDKEANLPYIIFLVLGLLAIFFAILLKQIEILRKITEYVPESGCLMVIGVFISLILTAVNQVWKIQGQVEGVDLQEFLLVIQHWIIEHFMIAPIILHAF